MKHTGGSVWSEHKNRHNSISTTVFSVGLGVVFCVEILILLVTKQSIKTAFNPAAYMKMHPCVAGTRDESPLVCWQKNIVDVMRERGTRDAFELVKYAYETDAETAEACHGLTHEVGKLTYRLFLSGEKVSISPNVSYCSYGFFHGFAEELFSRNKDVQKARDFCRYVDRQLKDVSKDASLQCFHGIGHGIVDNHNPEFLGNQDAIVNAGLSICKRVGETELERSRCATGVFNGLAFLLVANGMGLSINPDDPLEICRKQTPTYEDACNVSMNIVLLTLSHMDILAASQYLKPIESDEFARNAMINLASPVGTRNAIGKNHKEAVEICRKVDTRIRLACIQGYAFGLMEHARPGREYESAIEFCGSYPLSDIERDACYSYILPYTKQWYPTGIYLKVCGGVQSAFKHYCEI